MKASEKSEAFFIGFRGGRKLDFLILLHEILTNLNSKELVGFITRRSEPGRQCDSSPPPATKTKASEKSEAFLDIIRFQIIESKVIIELSQANMADNSH